MTARAAIANRSMMRIESGLYVAATPIGNLGDATYRLIETLGAADLILCEDTRQTAKLCAAYAIRTPRAAYHDHNADAVRPAIVARLKDGARICLVSDAGTPLISDPGYKLVRDARRAGVKVYPLPGPSAVTAALSAAGAPTDRFLFAGFPPPKAAARDTAFRDLAGVAATLVFFETGPRLARSLAAMAAAFGDRRAVIARELTKIHEEFREGNLAELAAGYGEAPPKGEIVVIVFPPEPETAAKADIEAFLKMALTQMSVKDAAAAASEALGASRREAYERALAIRAEKP